MISKWFACQYCKKGFRINEGMKKHIEMALWFDCQYCKKGFGINEGKKKYTEAPMWKLQEVIQK